MSSICNPTTVQATLDDCGNAIETPQIRTPNELNEQQSELNKSYTNKFLMVVDIPPIVRQNVKGTPRECSITDVDKLHYNIFGTTVPTISLPSVAVPFSGLKLKVSSHSRDLEPMNVNYFVDNTFDNYWVLFKWADYVVNALHGFAGFDRNAPLNEEIRRNYNVLLKDYATTITVIGMSVYNEPKIEWLYKGCVITSIGGINYNYQTANEITSSFAFDYSFLDCVLR